MINASDLRATLLAFLLAFWQHLLETRGGLSLLLLDDLQEMFDRRNLRLVANAIPTIVQSGGHPIITTNDDTFGKSILASCVRSRTAARVDRRVIHPLNGNRRCIELGHFEEEIRRRRNAFEDPKNQNDDQVARDYVNELRIYLEQNLVDLLEQADVRLPESPTLSDLMDAIRARHNAGQELFSSPVFRELVADSHLASGSNFVRLMHESHHHAARLIAFTDVWQLRDACERVERLVEAAHEDYEGWLKRDLRDASPRVPALPPAMITPAFRAPVFDNLAAFTSGSSATEPVESGEYLEGNWFTNCRVYALNTHNFGFAATPNSRAIVELSDEKVPDRSLVIALHGGKLHAGRLLRDVSNPRVIVLASEAQNPVKRRPALFLPAAEVRLLRVVGILFDDRPFYPVPAGDAALADGSDLLRGVQVVFRVTDESAIPLALPKQIVLGGACLTPKAISESEGSLVAIATSDDAAFFKRVGKALPGAPHVRLFESVGGLGDSVVVRTEEVEDEFSKLPLLVSARRVLGVLYERD